MRGRLGNATVKPPMDLSRYDNSDFDRGAPKWKEAVWYLVRWWFFLTAFPWPSALRVRLLRRFGASIGRGVVVRGGVNVSFPWRLTVGDHVWIGEDAGILSLAPVVLESNVCVSQRAYLCSGSHDFRRADFPLVTRPITVRTGSWVAAAAFVGPGVEIGAGALVAAGSVVMGNVPPGCLVRGNPAVVVKTGLDAQAASVHHAAPPSL